MLLLHATSAGAAAQPRVPAPAPVGAQTAPTLAAPAPAAVAPAEPRRGSLLVETRVTFGLGDVSRVTLLLYGAGGEWRVAPTLALRGTLLAMTPLGTVEDGEPARFGAGGDAQLRMMPWPALPVRPFAYLGAGLMLFPEEVFLPGGTRHDFLLSFGLGADVTLARRWAISAAAHYAHLSNGQGLGDFNPAFDGIGGSLALSGGASPIEDLACPQAHDPRRAGRDRWAPGAVVDATAGTADGEALVTGRLRVAQRLAAAVLVVGDLEGGVFAKEALLEVGSTLVVHTRRVSLGARFGYRDFAGIRVPNADLQAEWHLTPETSLVGMGAWESPSGLDPVWRASLGLRSFPVDTLAIDLGVGIGNLGDEALADASDPYLGIEWQVPPFADDWQLSLFLERQVSGLSLVGARTSFGMGPTLRDAARHDGFRLVR